MSAEVPMQLHHGLKQEQEVQVVHINLVYYIDHIHNANASISIESTFADNPEPANANTTITAATATSTAATATITAATTAITAATVFQRKDSP